jgi:hypothetical protein
MSLEDRFYAKVTEPKKVPDCPFCDDPELLDKLMQGVEAKR